MEGKFSINELAAPKDWKAFTRWHKLTCTSDPMTADERFAELGGVIPKKNVSKSDPSAKKTK